VGITARVSLRVVLSALLSLLLVVGFLEPTAAQAAQKETRSEVPPISSPAVKTHGSRVPVGEFDPKTDGVAAVIPRPKIKVTKPSKDLQFDESTAKVTDTDEFSTTFTDAKGLHLRKVSTSAENAKVDGKWDVASSNLSGDGADGLQVKANPLAPKFAGKADSSKLFQATRNGYTISFALKGAAASSIQQAAVPFTQIGADRATYFGVLPDTDLHYQVSAGDVKEAIVLKKVPALSRSTYVWSVKAPDLTVVKNDREDLEFRDSSGEVVFTMPRPVMWDSSGKEGERTAALINVPYEIAKKSGSMWTLTLRPDRDWLTDSARVYPVTLDPTISPGPTTSIPSSLTVRRSRARPMWATHASPTPTRIGVRCSTTTMSRSSASRLSVLP
jgi:hypothetical protein